MAETVPLNYADQLTKMADNTNPHNIETKNAQKLVTLSGLKRYNHALISKLGLTNDSAAYAYATSGTYNAESNKTGVWADDAKTSIATGWEKATSVKKCIDQLYDLVGANAGFVSVAAGKYTKAGTETVTEVAFKKEGDSATEEKYYINLKDAQGNVTNISFDAESFVKDGVIAGGQIIYGPSTGVTDKKDATITGTQTWADVLPQNGSKTKGTPETATDTYIELVVKNAVDPDATQTYSTITLKASDLLGDLVGGAGIDITNGTVKVDLLSTSYGLQLKNDGEETADNTKKLALKLAETQDNYVVLSEGTTANKGLVATTNASDGDNINFATTGKYSSGKGSPVAADTIDKSTTTAKAGVDYATSLTFQQVSEKNNLATEKELINTANFLQKEIESLAGKGGSTVAGQGNVTYEGDATADKIQSAVGITNGKDSSGNDKVIVAETDGKGQTGGVVVTKTTDKTTGAISYDVYTVVANDNDIDGLFEITV